jgi:hypothetical protein
MVPRLYNMTPRFVSSKLKSLFANNLYLYSVLCTLFFYFGYPNTQDKQDRMGNQI